MQNKEFSVESFEHDADTSSTAKHRCSKLATGVPREILECYFTFLSPLDLISCSLVCQSWNLVIMQNANLYNRLRCYENMSAYPSIFDENSEDVMKFKIFRNWSFYKRLLLFYNCQQYTCFDQVSGIVQPSFNSGEYCTNWTSLKDFLVDGKMHSIAINRGKDQLRLIKCSDVIPKQDSDKLIASFTFPKGCTGCAVDLVRGDIPFGAISCFVYVYIMRSQPGVNVTLVSFNEDMTEHVREDICVGNLSIDADLGQGIKFVQVNGLSVVQNFIFFEVNCFNLTQSRVVSHSVILNVVEKAAVPHLEVVPSPVQTDHYNLNVMYYCFNRTLFILKCTHFKSTESLYKSLLSFCRQKQFLGVHIIETNTRELKFYSFWSHYLLYVDDSHKRVYSIDLHNITVSSRCQTTRIHDVDTDCRNAYKATSSSIAPSITVTKLNDDQCHMPGAADSQQNSSSLLISVANGDVVSLRTDLDYLFVHVTAGITKLLVYRLHQQNRRRYTQTYFSACGSYGSQSMKELVAFPVSDFVFAKHCKDVEVVGCFRKKLCVKVHHN